jgi:uncharacterized membrane protein (UPF0127 family)
MKRIDLLYILAALLGLGILASFFFHSTSSKLATITMKIGSENFTLEVASTPQEKQTGLMHRDEMDANHGMIFPFANEEIRNFWNHDVHFDLDLLFVDSAGKVVSIKRMKQYSDDNTSSDYKAKYVIELNGGSAQRVNVKPGDKLQIPPIPNQ